MFHRALAKYDRSYSRFPMTVAFATCAVKACASDVVAQKQLEGASRVDRARTGKFTVWGGLYCGCFQHLLYNVLYPRLFAAPSGRGGQLKIVQTLLFELCVHFPLVANPVYYTCNSVFTGGTFIDGLREYRDDFWRIMSMVWAVWTPAHFVTFAVVPPPFRIAWVASVSFGWLVVLSFVNPMVPASDKNNKKGREEDAEG